MSWRFAREPAQGRRPARPLTAYEHCSFRPVGLSISEIRRTLAGSHAGLVAGWGRGGGAVDPQALSSLQKHDDAEIPWLPGRIEPPLPFAGDTVLLYLSHRFEPPHDGGMRQRTDVVLAAAHRRRQTVLDDRGHNADPARPRRQRPAGDRPAHT